jgi:hypothetical protein
MRLAIICSPDDGEMAVKILRSLRDEASDAFVLKMGAGWETLSRTELDSTFARATHFILLWSKTSARASWMAFASGYSLSRAYHAAIYRLDADISLYGYLSTLPIIDTIEELCAYYEVEGKNWQSERQREDAKLELMNQGYAVTATAFAESVDNADLEAVDLFLRAGLSANSRDRHGVPLICHAARTRHKRMVEELVRNQADIDAVSEDRGNTALMDAAAEGDFDIVQYLLRSGAKTDFQSRNGQTALIIAIGRNDAAITRALLLAGANPDIVDKLGLSARKYAELFHNEEINRLLAS